MCAAAPFVDGPHLLSTTLDTADPASGHDGLIGKDFDLLEAGRETTRAAPRSPAIGLRT